MATVGVQAAHDQGYEDYWDLDTCEPPDYYTGREKEMWWIGYRRADDEQEDNEDEYNGLDL